MMAGTFLSIFMTTPWQLFLTWGLMVGIGSGAGAVGMAAAVANRWFARRTGLAMGLLTAANAAGQLIFLPLIAWLASRYGWQAVAIAVTVAVGVMLPLVALMLPDPQPPSGWEPMARPRCGSRRRARAIPSPWHSPPSPAPRASWISGSWSSASASAASLPTA